MKGFTKLIPAALAVFALASCTSDDLQLQVGDKAPQQDLEQGDLIITYDPLDNEKAGTRAFRQGDFSMSQPRPMVYGEGDIFKVYDPDMFKYEAYEFNYNGQGNAFFKKNNVTISDPQFVLFPGDKVMRGYYNSDNDKTYAEIEIPRVIEYGADSETFVDAEGTVVGYAYNLPQLGLANPLEGGKMGANKLRHLTAILKVDLKNVFSNATWLRITNQAGKVMSGTIAAVLDVSSEDARKAVKLDPSLNKPDLVTYPDMYVDLRNVPSPNSVIFIPILEGLTEADNIKLEFTAYTGDLDETPGSDWLALIEQGDAGWGAATTEQKWVNTGMEFPGVNFKHNNLYEGQYEFSFDNMSPNKITQLLDQYKETTLDINIDLTKDLAMDDNTIANPAGYEILVPTLTNDKDIAINLASTFASITNDATNTATKLVIANAPGADFTGTFTLNVADKLPAATALDIDVDLPNADVVLLGDFDNITNKNLNLIAANSVTIGSDEDGVAAGSTKITTAKLNLNKLGDDVLALTVAKSAEVTPLTALESGKNTADITINGTVTGNVKSVSEVENEINITGSVSGNVTFNPVTATQYAGWENNTTITGTGRVGGAVDLSKNLLGTLTIDAIPTDNGTADPIVGGNVTTGGKVIVNLTPNPDATAPYTSGEGVAIAGTLTMTGGTKELKLIQGYINTIEVDVNNAGSWENKFINITLNDANEGFAAFATLTETNGFAKYTESVWNGEYPTNINYFRTNVTAAPTEKSLYRVNGANGMFTATQLAWFAEHAMSTFVHLQNDIDMKSKTFKGLMAPSMAVTFEGKAKVDATDNTSHKISNLKLYNAEVHNAVGDTHTTAAPMGLFNTATSALTVEYLTLENVEAQTDLMPYGTTLAVPTGFTTHTGNVVVGVGALVGNASAKVTAKYVDVTLKNQKFGYTETEGEFINVGGLIGYANAGADIQNTNVSGAPISGYRQLGGLIGTAATAGMSYDFTACTTNVTFNQEIANNNTMDCKYASIGGFIGKCEAKPNVTLVGAANSTAAIDDTQNAYWGKMYVSSTTTSDGRFYNFERKQNFLGFSGRVPTDADYGFGIVKINSVVQDVPATVPNEGTANSLYIFNTEH